MIVMFIPITASMQTVTMGSVNQVMPVSEPRMLARTAIIMQAPTVNTRRKRSWSPSWAGLLLTIIGKASSSCFLVPFSFSSIEEF